MVVAARGSVHDQNPVGYAAAGWSPDSRFLLFEGGSGVGYALYDAVTGRVLSPLGGLNDIGTAYARRPSAMTGRCGCSGRARTARASCSWSPSPLPGTGPLTRRLAYRGARAVVVSVGSLSGPQLPLQRGKGKTIGFSYAGVSVTWLLDSFSIPSVFTSPLHPPGADPKQVGGGDHADERLLSPGSPAEQPVREVAARAQLRDPQLDAANPGVPRPVPVAVAAVHAFLGALPVAGAAHCIGISTHHRLGECAGEHGEHGEDECAVRGGGVRGAVAEGADADAALVQGGDDVEEVAQVWGLVGRSSR